MQDQGVADRVRPVRAEGLRGWSSASRVALDLDTTELGTRLEERCQLLYGEERLT